MAAVMSVVAMVTRIPFVQNVVPFSMQPLIALLAGVLLGSRLGALSMAVYLLLGLAGVPVFVKAPFGGPAYVLQPTFGFLLSYIAAAYAAGKILQGDSKAGLTIYVLASLVGVVVIYLIGLPYLYAILNFYLGKGVPIVKVLQIGFLPFILWDILKAMVAAALARAVHRRLPEFSPKMEG